MSRDNDVVLQAWIGAESKHVLITRREMDEILRKARADAALMQAIEDYIETMRRYHAEGPSDAPRPLRSYLPRLKALIFDATGDEGASRAFPLDIEHRLVADRRGK